MLENYADKLKRHFKFSPAENKHFLWLAVAFGFILSFQQWGTFEFNFIEGFKNWVIAVIAAAIALFVHHAAQRMLAIHLGFRAEQKLWLKGLLISLVLVFFSNGNVMIFTGSETTIHALAKHRLGKKRKDADFKTIGAVCMIGPAANIVFAGILYILSYANPNAFITQLSTFSLVFALWNLLPLPPLDGGKMFFGSRLVYSWFAGAALGFIASVWVLGLAVFPALVLSVITGTVFWILFWAFYERNL